MRGAVYVNGTISAADAAVIPVFDHGFMYGEGVYEVLRTYGGVPFLYDRHVTRLRNSARYLHLDVPVRRRARCSPGSTRPRAAAARSAATPTSASC